VHTPCTLHTLSTYVSTTITKHAHHTRTPHTDQNQMEFVRSCGGSTWVIRVVKGVCAFVCVCLHIVMCACYVTHTCKNLQMLEWVMSRGLQHTYVLQQLFFATAMCCNCYVLQLLCVCNYDLLQRLCFSTAMCRNYDILQRLCVATAMFCNCYVLQLLCVASVRTIQHKTHTYKKKTHSKISNCWSS